MEYVIQAESKLKTISSVTLYLQADDKEKAKSIMGNRLYEIYKETLDTQPSLVTWAQGDVERWINSVFEIDFVQKENL